MAREPLLLLRLRCSLLFHLRLWVLYLRDTAECVYACARDVFSLFRCRRVALLSILFILYGRCVRDGRLRIRFLFVYCALRCYVLCVYTVQQQQRQQPAIPFAVVVAVELMLCSIVYNFWFLVYAECLWIWHERLCLVHSNSTNEHQYFVDRWSNQTCKL